MRTARFYHFDFISRPIRHIRRRKLRQFKCRTWRGRSATTANRLGAHRPGRLIQALPKASDRSATATLSSKLVSSALQLEVGACTFVALHCSVRFANSGVPEMAPSATGHSPRLTPHPCQPYPPKASTAHSGKPLWPVTLQGCAPCLLAACRRISPMTGCGHCL